MANDESLSVLEKINALIRRRGFLGSARYLFHWISEKYYEKRFRINSSGFVSLADAGCLDVDSNYGPYEPSAYAPLFRALATLTIDPESDVFLDLGAGKGRVVIAAATKPFKKAFGVELSKSLTDLANANIAKASSMLKCKEVFVETGNAETYQLPSDVTVLHLYGPFFGPPMDALIDRIEESLRKFPRKLTIIFRFPSWAKDSLANRKSFHRGTEFSCYSDEGETVRVYSASGV